MPAKKKAATPAVSSIVQPLRSLLHTIRCVSQHEDALCTLLHNLEKAPHLTAELHTELSTLLDQLPAREYLDDFDAVHTALEASASRS